MSPCTRMSCLRRLSSNLYSSNRYEEIGTCSRTSRALASASRMETDCTAITCRRHDSILPSSSPRRRSALMLRLSQLFEGSRLQQHGKSSFEDESILRKCDSINLSFLMLLRYTNGEHAKSTIYPFWLIILRPGQKRGRVDVWSWFFTSANEL